MQKYTGNCPESVKKDAKYHIRVEGNEYVVGITYTTDSGEYWTPTTTEHPELVAMVNRIKDEFNAQKGGAFYINEYRQVIVPTTEGYFCAGEYHKILTFTLKNFADDVDVEISGKPRGLDGNKLKLGETWEGCLMGIPYILTAGGNDIRFEIKLSETHFRKVLLSRATNPAAARALARRLSRTIGNDQGGRFYINDQREMFKPITENGWVKYIYIGKLQEDDPWFPKTLFVQEVVRLNPVNPQN